MSTLKNLLTRTMNASWIVFAALLMSAASAFADNGAIWTSLSNGASVNSNLYDSKSDVYLNGGPKGGGGGLDTGVYIFMVTDPSGAVLLSQDPAECRKVNVANGVIFGSTGSCPHPNGTPDTNGAIPVQLMPFDDSPNGGGEYKVWLTKESEYDEAGCPIKFGFCSGAKKSDNFKVREQGLAHVVACKYNDANQSAALDTGDTFIEGWPITITVGTTANTGVTDATGCYSVAVSSFPTTILVSEGTLGGNWIQTAPSDGSASRSGTMPAYTASGGSFSTTDLRNGDLFSVQFGNFLSGGSTEPGKLFVTKTANPSFKVNWTIDKTASPENVNTNGATVNPTYTITVSHTASNFVVTGTITAQNTGGLSIDGNITDSAPGATCVITPTELAPSDGSGGVNVLMGPGEILELAYTCTYASIPAPHDNIVTATWSGSPGLATGTALVDFAAATIVDDAVDVSDTLKTLSPATLVYPLPGGQHVYSYADVTLNAGDPGTCVDRPNTASFQSRTTNSTHSGSDGANVRICRGADLTVEKTASGTFKRTYDWSIEKRVNTNRVNLSGGSATFNYTVVVTQVGSTDSDMTVTGNIRVRNPNTWQAVTVNVTDSVAGCTVTGGSNVSVPANGFVDLAYSCSPSSSAAFSNTATATWDGAAAFTPGNSVSASANVTFTPTLENQSPTVTDTFNGGSAEALTPAPVANDTTPTVATYTYSRTILAPAPGTCTPDLPNTAAFTSTSDSGSASQTVKVCAGADLTVTKAGQTSFTRTYRWNISKSVVGASNFVLGGTANYSVVVSQDGPPVDGGWAVSGVITVSNPNTWQAVTVNVTDSVPGCTITGGTNVSVPASGSVQLNYTCAVSSGASFTNTATATWDATAAATPTGQASGSNDNTFSAPNTTLYQTVNVSDLFNGTVSQNLGSVEGNEAGTASRTFPYSNEVPPPETGCTVLDNVARIVETGQTRTASVTNCNSGAHTIGFWQNKNGQEIISLSDTTESVCDVGTFLRTFAPFKDLSPTAACGAIVPTNAKGNNTLTGTVTEYVASVIRQASGGKASMNAMLKAQMLATALDVYFSEPGQNEIGAPLPIGGLSIDLTNVRNQDYSVFWGGESKTIMQLLNAAADASNVGGSNWYGQDKVKQEKAKNTFDAINNEDVNAP